MPLNQLQKNPNKDTMNYIKAICTAFQTMIIYNENLSEEIKWLLLIKNVRVLQFTLQFQKACFKTRLFCVESGKLKIK